MGLFFDGVPLDELLTVVKRAVCRSDPYGLLARGQPDEAYDREVHEIARRLAAGEMLVPGLVADVLRRRGVEVDPEDVREITRQIGVGLGFG